MTFFRMFLVGVFCAGVSLPALSAACGGVGQKECNGSYYVCAKDSDCVAGKLPSNATAGHCVSAGRSGYKVCTATACNNNYEVKSGRCQKKSGATTSTTPKPDFYAECTLKFASGKEITKVNDAWESYSVEYGDSVDYSDSDENTLMTLDKKDKAYDPATPSLRDLVAVDGKNITDEEKKYLQNQGDKTINFDCRGNGTYLLNVRYKDSPDTRTDALPEDEDLFDSLGNSQDSECSLTFANGRTLSDVGFAWGKVLHGEHIFSNTGKITYKDYEHTDAGQISSIYFRKDPNYCVAHNDFTLDVRDECKDLENTPHMQDLVAVNGNNLNAADIEKLKKADSVTFYCVENGYYFYLDFLEEKSGDNTGNNSSVSNDVVVAATGALSNGGEDGTASVVGAVLGDENSGGSEKTGNEQQIKQKQQHVNEIISNGNITKEDKKEIAATKADIVKLQKAYDDAKANEQSTANKMLGGLTMAATGIGGMQLAQGLAEQSADAAAEADMTAYLQTFQCRVADKTYKGGEFSIPVGGGNELIELYQQYVDMAADLKERKNALGLKAGIESEVVMDKANMGLYDDKGKGIENGTFASLYRASKGNETDAAKLAAQKESAQTRVKAGAVAAGAGVVGGLIGNQLLNEKSGKKGTDSVVETVKSVVNKNGVIDDSVAKLTDKVVDDNILAPVVTDDAGDDEAKLKECLDYINGPDLFDWVSVGECTRLAVSVSNDSDVVYVLSDDEAASLSPMWNWGCYNAESQENDSRKVWVYGDGNREYSEIADEEKDACETVEKVKAFVAEHNKSCEEYDNRVVWNDGNKNVCVQKDWVPVENKVEESVEEVKTGKRTLKYREPCTEEDKKYYPVSDHAVITWYYNGKCVPQDITDKNPCEEGYELARDAKGKTQGWCKKSSKKKK